MLFDESIWIKGTKGYFEKEDPALFGVTESKVDLAKYPYDINGKNSGFITMNGLAVAGSLGMARGIYHYFFEKEEETGDEKTIWAEYATEKSKDGDERIFLMRIHTKNQQGIKYTYTRVCGAEIVEFDTKNHRFVPVWNLGAGISGVGGAVAEDAEESKLGTGEALRPPSWSIEDIEKMPYAPAISIIPAIIARCALDKEVEERVNRLKHLPENKYLENQNLYWLSQYFYVGRSENYSRMADLSELSEEECEHFVNRYLDNVAGWELKDVYSKKNEMGFGNISEEQLANIFSTEELRNSELGKLIPDINIDDYYVDPKLKDIVDLIVLEKDGKIPVNTGMLYGPPASGKSTAVMVMAYMLQLPYVPVTFNSNISMDDLLGSWQPTEDGKIHFVESTFVQAYQSPSVVEFVECYYVKPGACGDLNTALDDTAQITLPNGKIIYRHPACIIVATINAGQNENEYRAVREQDVSFDRRFEGFKEYFDFFDEDVFAEMISKKSGYKDHDEILIMIKVMKEMNKSSEETGDWQIIYPSSIIRWAQHRKYKDIISAAHSTILPAASKNLEIQKDIMEHVLDKYF